MFAVNSKSELVYVEIFSWRIMSLLVLRNIFLDVEKQFKISKFFANFCLSEIYLNEIN